MTARRLALVACATSMGLAACGDDRSNDAGAPLAAATESTATPAATATPSPLADPAVQAALRAEFPEADASTLFATATADLDANGTDEVFAYAYGPGVCGSGGCNLVVLTHDGEAYRTVARTSVTQEPVRLLDTASNGWKDLSVGVGGGGIPAAQVRLQFDGKAYPSNPTVLPDSARVDAEAGTLLIGDPLQGGSLPPA